MAHIVFDEVFENGQLVSRVQRTVSDSEEVQQNAGPQLRTAYATLRQWATDAATANTNWPTMTAAQKDATTRETVRRLGVFLDRFGDLLVLLSADQ